MTTEYQFKFINGQQARIINTTDHHLDGTKVTITGVSSVPAGGKISPTNPVFYIIEKSNGVPFKTRTGEWKSMVLIENCLVGMT